MSVVKTPTSSLTASQLLVNRLWYRTKAGIKRLFGGGTPKVSTACSSPVTKLPQELVEMILSHLIYNRPSLLACSMTCYSWYIAAAPYLHYSLTTDDEGWRDRKNPWPRPLQKSYELGLLPLVKRFRVRLRLAGPHRYWVFGPSRLSRRTLRCFSALTNLQELGIDYLQVSDFMPTIRECFGHLSPTLRFLALKEPNGSCRQILYFIGLFPNLQDLKLHCCVRPGEQESIADATLVPLSIPPLRGRLILTCFARENLVRDMIAIFGGLRFRYMDLFRVKCIRLLLYACAETLETLKLYPTDTYADHCAPLEHFDLSRNKTLRTLETTADSIQAANDTAPDFLKTVLSSVTSPAPFDIVIVYPDTYIFGTKCCRHGKPGYQYPCSRLLPPLEMSDRAQFFQEQFRVFRAMHSGRDFRLVLCADVFDCVVERARQTLEHFVKAEKAKGGLDYLLREPLIISEKRTIRTRDSDHNVGWSKEWIVIASAL